MTLPTLSKALTSVFNSLGNQWLIENSDESPFQFKVFVRRADIGDYKGDLIAEVYTDRPVPWEMKYKKNSEKGAQGIDGFHNSVLSNKLEELANYVDVFGGFGKTLAVEFMDQINNLPPLKK